jgi:hypothetical protein
MLRRPEPKRPIGGLKIVDIKKLYPRIPDPPKKKPKFYQK